MAIKNGKTQLPKDSQQQIPPVTNPRGVRSVYSNNMDVTMGMLDVRLDFHEVFPDQGKLLREQRASVVMSIPHFRAVMKVLNSQMPKLDLAVSEFEKALANQK
jgi:hypothetical protein